VFVFELGGGGVRENGFGEGLRRLATKLRIELTSQKIQSQIVRKHVPDRIFAQMLQLKWAGGTGRFCCKAEAVAGLVW